MVPLDFIRTYIQNLTADLRQLPLEDLVPILKLLQKVHEEDRQVFLVGNGGSAATAQHMANDLLKGVAKAGGRGFRAICLSCNPAVLTAIANDEAYEEVFASQLSELARAGDLLILFSASGNSPNILRAAEQAHRIGMTTVGFLGMEGGKALPLLDYAFIVPSKEYGPIEGIHLMLEHLITDYLKEAIKGVRASENLA